MYFDKRIKSRLVVMIILSFMLITVISADGTVVTNNRLETQMIPQLEEIAYIEDTGGDSFSSIAYDDVLIVMDMDGGLKFYNISDPSNPIYMSYYYDGGIPHDMYKVGDLLYLADHYHGLEIYNISNPSNPIKLGSITDDGDGEMDGVFVKDELAYVAEWHDSTGDWSMKIINVTEPTTPIEVVEYTDDDNLFIRFFVKNDLCYTSCLEGGFKILNVSEPMSIGEVSHFTDLYYAFEFEMIDDTVYLADGEGFNILDVSLVNAPTKIANYSTTQAAFGCDVEGDFAYIGVSETGLYVLNISDTQNIIKVGEFAADNIVNIDVQEDLVFLSMHGDGLKILQISMVNPTEGFPLPLFSILLVFPALFLITKKRRSNK
ncbi:MAG: hypothetical protein FK730_13835 [Asgard group archaeon]|nr:hypothetical protein [Asgard group archaeon]